MHTMEPKCCIFRPTSWCALLVSRRCNFSILMTVKVLLRRSSFCWASRLRELALTVSNGPFVLF